jgi:hypothetical protein
MKHLLLIVGCLFSGGCASFGAVNEKFDAREANLQSYCNDNPAEAEFCQNKMAELQSERNIELQDVATRHQIGGAMLMKSFSNMGQNRPQNLQANCTTTVIGDMAYTHCQ